MGMVPPRPPAFTCEEDYEDYENELAECEEYNARGVWFSTLVLITALIGIAAAISRLQGF